MCDELRACGFSVEKVVNVTGITVNGMRLRRIVPDFGKPGIAASSLLYAAVQVFTGQAPQSTRMGQGYRYRDILEQLKKHLDVDGGVDRTG